MKSKETDEELLANLNEDLREKVLIAWQKQIEDPVFLEAEPVAPHETIVGELEPLEVICFHVASQILEEHSELHTDGDVDNKICLQVRNDVEELYQLFESQMLINHSSFEPDLYQYNVREGNKIVRMPISLPGEFVVSFGLPVTILVIDENGVAQVM